ncbi:hypothetical protein PLESTB_001710400 [Pleodorina starrii]|uniref:Uncharacterized protein n=1 Tax=Pleodorina starrii TaxID=330485 RepID=A0A9W6F984_9CHLO|nr:hypothetical protein PLESTB_001710400 [Pleodorina starrii]GLC75849.1 hypothetical protein PLESTF_001695900 [Pleodorina starrii]
MIDSKTVRSPAGQKLINDLMLGDDELEVGGALDDAGDAGDARPTVLMKLRGQRRSSGPLRPSVGSRRRGSLPASSRTVGSAKTAPSVDSDTDPATGRAANRPATAPATSHTLLLPPQLPAARTQRDLTGQQQQPPPSPSGVSPLLERHLVSRHTNAYLGVVTAVLHQVSSPATTGANRDTLRRPGTVPRDVYHHSAIPVPRRRHLTSMASADSSATTEGIGGTFGGSGSGGPGGSAADASCIVAPGSPPAYRAGGTSRRTTADEPPRGHSPASSRVGPVGPFGSMEFSDGAGGHLFGSFGHGSLVGPAPGAGGLTSRGGSGEYSVPYLDRAYGSHAPMACAVDAVARRAEAHKALTRQRLLQKQLDAHMAAGSPQGPAKMGRRHADHQHHHHQQGQGQGQNQLGLQQGQQGQQGQQQQQPQHLVLFQTSNREPYQLRMEGAVPPVSLGLSWDTSPGVVAAAAAAAATAAAAIAARAEGLSAAASPILMRDVPASPSLRDLTFSPAPAPAPGPGGAGRVSASAASASRGGSTSMAAGGLSPRGGLRRRLGNPSLEWAQPPPHQVQQQQQQGAASSGLLTPAGAPSSPRKAVRLPRTPQSAAEAAALAAEAEAAARSHLPPAVRRGYSGQLAAQTVRDWETIAEPNRRMMQEIENATNLVRYSPSRSASMHHHQSAAAAAGGTSAAAASSSASASASFARGSRQPSPLSGTSAKRRGVGLDSAVNVYGTGADGGDVGGGGAGGGTGGAPFGQHTSARSRRRYVRYSLDVFPELGLPPRAGGDGPFGAAAAAAAATAAAAVGGGGWNGWPGAPGASAAAAPAGGELGPESEPSVGQMDEYDPGDEYGGDGEYGSSPYGSAKGARYMLAAAARVPVPVPMHPLPTPAAAVAAIVASGSAAGAAAASLPQWIDPLAAAATGAAAATARASGADATAARRESDAGGSPLPLLPSGSVSSGALPTVTSSSHSSAYGSRGLSRTTSVALAGLSARGERLQGHPSGPPLSMSLSAMLLEEQQSGGSWPGGGGGGGGSGGGLAPASPSRTVSLTRGRHGHPQGGHYHSSQMLHAGGASASFEELPYREHSVASAVGGLVSSEGASASAAAPQQQQRLQGSDSLVSPGGGRRRGGSSADSPAAQSSAAAAGFGSPAVEASLLPLPLPAQRGAGAAAARGEGGAATLAAAAAAELGRSPKTAGLGQRVDPGLVDLDLDLGRAASRESSAGKTHLPGSILYDSRLSTPGSHLPASVMGEEEGDEFGDEEVDATAYGDGGDSPGIAAAAAMAMEGFPGQAAAADGVGEEGWSFREANAPARASASSIAAAATMVSAGAAAAGGGGGVEGLEDDEWDAGPTPRLVSRLGPRGGGPPSPSAERPLPSSPGPRHSSLASEAASLAPRSTSAAAAVIPAPAVGPMPAEAAVAVGAAAAAELQSESALQRVVSDGSGVDAGPEAGTGARAEADVEAEAEADGTAFPGAEGLSDTEGPSLTPRRLAAALAAPQGPVLTHGTGYRVVTSVAAALVSEDPRLVARLAAQREVEAQLERSSEHSAKLKAASRATKALARATPQHNLPPASLPPLSGSVPSATLGYSIVQPQLRASRMGAPPAEEGPGAGSLSVLAAPVPAPAEMEAMTAAARSMLAAAPGVLASRAMPATPATPGSVLGAVAGSGPMRRPLAQTDQRGDRDRNPSTPLGPGSYLHVQAAIEPGRTVQMQDVWAN